MLPGKVLQREGIIIVITTITIVVVVVVVGVKCNAPLLHEKGITVYASCIVIVTINNIHTITSTIIATS